VQRSEPTSIAPKPIIPVENAVAHLLSLRLCIPTAISERMMIKKNMKKIKE
jgi:hypothetical protein